VVGQRLPSLKEVLSDPPTTWQRFTLDGYGQGERSLEICTGPALWDRATLSETVESGHTCRGEPGLSGD
jgi:hypothetical protein